MNPAFSYPRKYDLNWIYHRFAFEASLRNLNYKMTNTFKLLSYLKYKYEVLRYKDIKHRILNLSKDTLERIS